MKKLIAMFVISFAFIIGLPNNVYAEIKGCSPAFIELTDIELGSNVRQKTTYANGDVHFVSPTINITWYESTNGHDFTLMKEDSVHDYNIYYKAVLDTTYDELNKGMDEGWELCGLAIKIIDETGQEVAIKSYDSDTPMEYTFEPFWKYKVYLQLDNYEYDGPTEIPEGESYVGQLIPKKNYRLPRSDESYSVKILVGGNEVDCFDNDTGFIELEPWHLDGDIMIYASAIEKSEVKFKNNTHIYFPETKNPYLDLELEQFGDIDKVYVNDTLIDATNYSFDIDGDTLSLDREYLQNLNVGTYNLRIENEERYAETTFKIQPLAIVDHLVVDFTKISNSDSLTEDEFAAFEFVAIYKQFMMPNTELTGILNKNNKLILNADEDNNISVAAGVTYLDNITYTLTAEEMEYYKEKFSETVLPKKISLIFAHLPFKITLDANGGIFKDGKTTLEINDIINFDYESLVKPTREGYKFVGFYTEKNGGKSYEYLMNSEAGIEEDTILYARWEKEGENPKTFDGIGTSIFMGTLSLIGLVATTIYLKKRNKVRA